VSQWERDDCVPRARHWGKLTALLGRDLIHVGPGLPNRLRAARLRLGLSREDLAERAGIDARTVRNWERGASAPSERTLAKAVAVLGPISGTPPAS